MKRVRLFAWLPFAAGAQPAFAHSPVPGIEGFYVGLLHPFSTPSQAILIVGLGLLVSGFASKRAGWHLASFLTATLVGLFLALRIAETDTKMFALGFVTCASAALLPGRLMALNIAIVCVGGFLIGDASIPDEGPTSDRLFTMSGSFVGANLGLFYLFGITHFIRDRYPWPWVAVAFRVAAAWLGAIALLMLALSFTEIASPS